jgi:hypothetical protein
VISSSAEAQQDQGDHRRDVASTVNRRASHAERDQPQQLPQSLAAITQVMRTDTAKRRRPDGRIERHRQRCQRRTAQCRRPFAGRVRQASPHDRGKQRHGEEIGGTETPPTGEKIGALSNGHDWCNNDFRARIRQQPWPGRSCDATRRSRSAAPDRVGWPAVRGRFEVGRLGSPASPAMLARATKLQHHQEVAASLAGMDDSLPESVTFSRLGAAIKR